MRIYLGMKRVAIEKLRDELTTALDTQGDHIDVTVYGDVDDAGVVLQINNDDMERPEVPADAIYSEVDDD